MTARRAKELTEQVVAMVPQARYFTNTETEDGLVCWGSGFQMKGWDSMTESTFDTGVLMLSDTQIGIFWVKDED